MGKIRIIFDGPPGPEGGRFVEVEGAAGESFNIGEWVECGDYWCLEIDDYFSTIDTLKKEIAALKAERDFLKKHQAICECGGLSIDHNINDNHQVSDMISPCPFKEQIADLKAEVEKLRKALKRIRDWPYDIMGDCVYDARKEAEDALKEAADEPT